MEVLLNAASETGRYKLSFTSGGLYARQAPMAAQIFRDLQSWPAVREALDADNLLQARTRASARRTGRELVQRLAELTSAELEVLLDATVDERAQLMWVAVCRRYKLVGEFAEEVLRERFLLLATDVLPEHFEAFVRGKSMWHEEINQLEASTMTKLRTSLFLMMREAGLLTEDGAIIPILLSGRVQTELTKRVPSDIRFFPTREFA